MIQKTWLAATKTDNNETQFFHLVDHIVVLGIDGSIAEQGTYDSLRSQTGYISNLLLKTIATNRADMTPSEGLMNKVLKGPSNEEVLDLTRKIGDFSVYSEHHIHFSRGR